MELLILLLLIVLNGALVLSEMSIVASRKARLQHWSDAGRPGARTALALANEPGYFLSTTQIGITVIGIVSGAFAAETVAKQLARFLAPISLLQPYADTLALVLVVTGITVCSLVLGELVPKRIALLHPEAIASAIARPMRLLSRLAFPLVKAMSVATDGVLRLLGSSNSASSPVSQEEIRVLMRQGAAAGVFDQNEQAMVSRVFRMDERRVTSVMTPRVDIQFLDLDGAFDAMRRFLNENPTATGEPAQNARAIVVIQAAKKGLLSEAEARLRDYANNQPQVADDRYSLENWLTVGYFNSKDYESALPHAQQLWKAAKLAAQDKPALVRDSTLNDAAVTLSEIHLKLKKKEDAIAVTQELRRLALALPVKYAAWLSLRPVTSR